MDRRNFLKMVGVGVGCVVTPSANTKAAGLDVQVSSLVLDPKDIIKDPMIGPVFDMNDDVTGMAGVFTMNLCCSYIKSQRATTDEVLTLLQWGMRQPACIGLLLAKEVTTVVFSDATINRERVAKHPIFKEMYTKYSELLTENNQLGQWSALRT